MRDGDTNKPLNEAMGIFHVSKLAGEPPIREWAVDQYIPKGSVTGLFGAGGVGKSLLAQQAATAVSLGLDWVGLPTKQSSVLGYFCEDDYDELWRRQASINTSLGLKPEELGDFYLESRVGEENILMSFALGIGKKTDFFKKIEADIKATNAQFLILDNAAQLFGGNENDRREVTQFVNALHGLIHGGDLTILMLGHPPKQPGQGTGHEYSGSTAWDACFRSRLWFGRPDGESDDETKEHRTLTKRKANYSSIGDGVTVEWKDGVFHTVKQDISFVGKLELSAKQKDAKAEFLERLATLNSSNRYVSHSPNSGNYAPRVMVAMGNTSTSKRLLEKAMQLLLDDGKIIANAEVGKIGSRKAIGLKIAGA